MIPESKQLFEQTFLSNYNNIKNFMSDSSEAAEKALGLARMVVMNMVIDPKVLAMWEIEMYMKYDVGIVVKKTPVMRPDQVTGWYDPKMIFGAFFWTRYRDYLLRIKGWTQEAIDSINDSTNEIMKSLGDPSDLEPFDKRGLVLGYVQSGKTANFTGLINKAYDVGYKLVIVLSGIHNDLRAQTQLRLDEEVVGNAVDKEGNPGGVAQIYANTAYKIISTLTTVDRDISSGTSGVHNLNQPSLIVAKKNSVVLESLKEQLEYHKNIFNLDIPVLIIDDEADQASVDTSKSEEDPKTINRLIRQILEVFSRKCYVGYTATPFANLLIGAEVRTEDEGYDLYPKDFLVGLLKPKDYCGPEEFFNVREEADDPRPSLIRMLEEPDTSVFTGIRKKGDAEKFEQVPPQMEESILAFLLTIAIRNLRGQRNKHNSMLIHTSRFKDVQSSVKDGVERTFQEIKNQIKYNPNGEVPQEIKKLYEEDIIPTTSEWSGDIEQFQWEEIYQELRVCIEKVQVFEINGNSKDALDYHSYKENGLNVIAVGGDKLSRGLTLEGLSITYYFRNTLMYDTLMQMGRWFGYRKGYMDLCRIYTSGEIASNFEHLAIAMIELRKEFDNLAHLGKKPLEYAVKMLSHPSMTLTSPLKMRNATSTNVIYKKTLQQTRIYGKTESYYIENMRATENLVNNILPQITKKTIGTGKTGYYMAENIGVDKVLSYLAEYKTCSGAEKVDTAKLINYIRTVNKNKELMTWTVVVVEGDTKDNINGLEPFEVQMGELRVNSAVVRGVKADKYNNQPDKIDIRAIVASRQEFVDIDSSLFKNIKENEEVRKMRPNEKGMLLIYPLHPKVKVFDDLNLPFSKNLVPIGIALSFPDSIIDDSKVYEANKTV
jgi:hypothetical protein